MSCGLLNARNTGSANLHEQLAIAIGADAQQEGRIIGAVILCAHGAKVAMYIPGANECERHDDNWQRCRICERIPFWYGALMKVPVHQVTPLQPNVDRLQTDKFCKICTALPTWCKWIPPRLAARHVARRKGLELITLPTVHDQTS
jgi:hypothetical protein